MKASHSGSRYTAVRTVERVVQVRVVPHVEHLVGLRRLASPDAHVLGVFFAHRHDRPEQLRPLTSLARPGAVDAKFVYAAVGRRRLQVDHRVEEADILPLQHWLHDRHVLLVPALVLRQRLAHARPLIEAGVAPQMPRLVELAELGGPIAPALAIVVAADRAADLLHVLDISRQRAGVERIGAQLVDHSLILRESCRPPRRHPPRRLSCRRRRARARSR